MIGLLLVGLLAADPPADQRSLTKERAGIIGTVTVTPAPVALVGEVRLTLTIEGDAPLTVEPVTLPTLPGWRVRGREEPTVDEPAGGRQRWRQSFRLTPDRPGELSLPPPVLRVQAGGRETPVEIAWEPLAVSVTTSLPRVDLDEARGVTGPELVPPPPPSAVRNWLIAAAVVVCLGVMLVLVGRRLRRPQPVPEPPPVEWALAALTRLEGRDPTDPVAADELADLLRGFLTRRYLPAAAGKTTAELLALLRPCPLAPDALAGWQALLERCDLARFARLGFAPDEWSTALIQVRDLVTASVPVSESAEAAQEVAAGEKA
jgi:hypothetical protein